MVHIKRLFLFSFLLYSCHSDTDSFKNVISDQSAFTLCEDTGIEFMNEIKENRFLNVLMYEYYHNGGGVAVGDINNDGLADVYFSSNLFENKLYLNKGDFKFEDITQKAGVASLGGFKTGVTMVDVNADGWLDIYVCQSGDFEADQRRNKLFINNKDLSFKESAGRFGLNSDAYSSQAYFFDVDNDNDLDLFLLNHQIHAPKGSAIENTRLKDKNVGDKLYINVGGNFIDRSDAYGLEQNPIGFGLSASIADFNRDGFLDIYVCNDYKEHDYFYLNNNGEGFTNEIWESFRKTSNFSMGSDYGDINNDGWLDLFVADMAAVDNYRIKTNMSGMDREAFENSVEEGFGYQYMYNTLQLNRGLDKKQKVRFSEIAQKDELSKTDWSWAPLFFDFDNDTDQDLFVSNGLRKEARNNDFIKKKINYLERLGSAPSDADQDKIIRQILNEMPSQKISNYFFENMGSLKFKDVSEDLFWDTLPSFSNGAAYGDFDNDGDFDLIVNNIDQQAFVFKNNSQNNFLRIKLVGPENNTNALGAHIKATLPDGTNVFQDLMLSRGYLSSVEPIVIIGLNKWDIVTKLEVVWPDKKVSSLENIQANQTLEIKYSDSTRSQSPNDNELKDLYFKGGEYLDFSHIENDFNDYSRELLLPHKLSAEGPAVAVGDVDNDGDDDFYLGSSFGYKGQLILNKGDDFTLDTKSDLTITKDIEDVAAEFFDLDGDGDMDLYLVSGSNEKAIENYRDVVLINDGNGVFNKTITSPAIHSGSCVKKCDYDKDGDIDLFVGGRSVPGQYGVSGHSYILENKNGRLIDVFGNGNSELTRCGMVTDAIWSDYNKDGWEDLIVVGEWMPIKIFINKQGRISQEALVLENTEGWWYTINSGDFNNDGVEDFVVGNLGLNYKYKASSQEPFSMYSFDFDQNNTHDIVLSYFQDSVEYPLRGRECSSNQIPFIKEKFPDYNSFGNASLEEVYTENSLQKSVKNQVKMFEHLLLMSNGDGKYEIQLLPEFSQLFSIKSMLCIDINNDGQLDIISAGNHLNSEAETPVSDASYGEIFLGDGHGFFESSVLKEELWLNGEVKSLKILNESNNKSKVLLIVSNDRPLLLYRFKKNHI